MPPAAAQQSAVALFFSGPTSKAASTGILVNEAHETWPRGRGPKRGNMMRKLLIASLVAAAQVLPAAHAAQAAELDGRSPFVDNQRGAFAGVRLRASLGGGDRDVRTSLTIAATAHSRRGADSRMAMGDGLELSFSPRKRKPELMLAGRRLDQMNLWGRPADEKKDLSTLATVAIVAGVVLVVGAVAFVHVANEASCFNGGTSFHGDDDGSD